MARQFQRRGAYVGGRHVAMLGGEGEAAARFLQKAHGVGVISVGMAVGVAEGAQAQPARGLFQKIEGIGAGRLIDQCGLKGQTEGGAQIFSKHANIIVNRGDATASDVRALIDLAQKRVADELGYELVPEITFVGDF